MAKAGSLKIFLSANSERLTKELLKARKSLGKFRRAAKKITAGIARMGKIAGAVAIGGLGILISQALKAGDELAKTAAKLGITTESLAGLQRAAKITGVEQKTLNKALTKMQKALFDADRGLLTYKQHFDALGLSTKEMMKLQPDEQFMVISDALKQVENQTLKTAIAYDLFGGRGTALLNTVELGSEGLKAFRQQAEYLGTAISGATAKKMEDFNDATATLGEALQGAANIIIDIYGPAITSLINSIAMSLPIAIIEASIWIDSMRVKMASTAVVMAEFNLAMFNMTTIPFGDAYREELRLREEMLNHVRTEVDYINNVEIPALEEKLAAKKALQGSFEFVPSSGGGESGKGQQQELEQVALTTHLQVMTDTEVAYLEAMDRANDASIAARIAGTRRAADFEIMTAKKKTQFVLGEMSALTAGASSNSRKMFKVNKILSIANGLLGLRESITSSYAAGAKIGGPVLGGIYATIAGGAQLANLNAIRKSSYGGGGGGITASSGSVPTAPSVALERDAPTLSAPKQAVVINIGNGKFTAEDAVNMLDVFKMIGGDGYDFQIETA